MPIAQALVEGDRTDRLHVLVGAVFAIAISTSSPPPGDSEERSDTTSSGDPLAGVPGGEEEKSSSEMAHLKELLRRLDPENFRRSTS